MKHLGITPSLSLSCLDLSLGHSSCLALVLASHSDSPLHCCYTQITPQSTTEIRLVAVINQPQQIKRSVPEQKSHKDDQASALLANENGRCIFVCHSSNTSLSLPPSKNNHQVPSITEVALLPNHIRSITKLHFLGPALPWPRPSLAPPLCQLKLCLMKSPVQQLLLNSTVTDWRLSLDLLVESTDTTIHHLSPLRMVSFLSLR